MPTKNKENIKTPMLSVRAAVSPSSIDKEKRTVELTWTTGASGLRSTWDGDRYYEELEVSESAIRLERLRNGAPLLDAHNGWSNRTVIGVVESVRIENGEGIATVRFATGDEDVDKIWRKVEQGILRNVSVGYKVYKYERIPADPNDEDRTPTMRAVDWEPMEISIVPIAFDSKSQIRGDETPDSFETEVISRGVATTSTEKEEVPAMDPKDKKVAADKATEENKERATENTDSRQEQPVDARAAATQAVADERQRVNLIQQAVRSARLESDFANELINEGVSIDQARAKIIDKLADADEQTGNTRSQNAIDINFGGNEQRTRSAMSGALIERVGLKNDNEDSKQYRHMRMMDMCRSMLQATGVNTFGMTETEIAKRAMTTSDLPNIFIDAMNKTLLQAYREQPQTFRNLGRRTTASDFKEINRIRMSAAPDLLPKGENGEFKHGAWSDGKESYALSTYGRTTSLTREMLINDDLAALARWMGAFGSAAARLESKLVWTDMILANVKMSDGKAIFHADHGNLGTAGAISTSTVGELRKLLRKQKGLQNEELDIQPRFIITGPDQETALNQFLSGEIYSNDQAGVVPQAMRNSLTPIVENRVTGNQFFLFADYNQIDTFEYCYLAGQEGVYLESEVEFLSGDLKIGARHDFAAKAIDWRGMAKNAGQ